MWIPDWERRDFKAARINDAMLLILLYLTGEKDSSIGLSDRLESNRIRHSALI